MDVVKLIRAVKSRNPLWDRKHAFYHDRIVTMGLWNDLAVSLDTDPDSARAKWKGLRDTFRGELRKVNKTIANGTPCRSTNWEYFDEMLFVKDQIYSNRRSLADVLNSQEKKTPADSSVDEGTESVDIADLCSQEVVEGNEEIEPLGGSDGESTAPSQVRFPPHKGSEGGCSPAPSHVPPQLHPTDDDYNFLMSILPQMRSLPTMRNLYVRLKIQELLYSEIVALQEST